MLYLKNILNLTHTSYVLFN